MNHYTSVNASVISENDLHRVNDMTQPHSHDYLEIYYFLGEEMTFFLDNMPLKLHTHDIVLVKKHMFHKTFYEGAPKNRQRANISFNEGYLHRYFDLETIQEILSLFNTPLLIHDNSALGQAFGQQIAQISADYNGNDKYSRLKGYHGILQLLLEFLHNADRFEKTPSIEGLLPEQNRISLVARYINEHYSENITLSSLADIFFVSKYFLSHSFKDTSGECITNFINRKRVAEAAYLLEATDIPLTDIGVTVGFNSPSYFIKTFKTYHRVSPGLYRVQKKNLRDYCERISEPRGAVE